MTDAPLIDKLVALGGYVWPVADATDGSTSPENDVVIATESQLRALVDAETEELRRMIATADTKLLENGARVGIVAGSDTAEWLADEVERLRQRIAELEKSK